MTQSSNNSPEQKSTLMAAIDLGSNSFHMVIARQRHGQLQLLDKLHEKVQLAAGLDGNRILSAEAQQRALACLASFAQRLIDLPRGAVRVVGTSTFREARNIHQFIYQAEQILGHPIEVISGREEARLIYLGIAHNNADDQLKRLVLDVGGGSTECIIGSRFDPIILESLPLGCVRFKRFFPNDKITPTYMQKAIDAALFELEVHKHKFLAVGWADALGSSGTIKSVQQACLQAGLNHQDITLPALEGLLKQVIDCKEADKLDLPGIKSDRKSIFAPGLAIVYALFQQLELTSLRYVDGALREGVLYDMVGRLHHEDVRDRSIKTLQQIYGVDVAHAHRVEITALQLAQLAKASPETAKFLNEEGIDLLTRACSVHEIGLAISHSHFHKHSAYLVQHSDLPGFFELEQAALACLIHNHRRKLHRQMLRNNGQFSERQLLILTILLRLAVTLNRSRTQPGTAIKSLLLTDQKCHLSFKQSWLNTNPLITLALEREKALLAQAQISLEFQ